MYPLIQVDGRTLVILRQQSGMFVPTFAVVASGRLSYDGDVLSLVTQDEERVLSAQELSSIQNVRHDTRIAECRGFDLFLIVQSDDLA
jgi:hypothetical protein